MPRVSRAYEQCAEAPSKSTTTVGRAVARQCLICLEADGGVTSVGHPIPESIGNTTIVLSAGVVCDRCNGGEPSVLDQNLAEFFPIKLRRTKLGVPSKTRKIPVTRFHDGTFEHNGVLAALQGTSVRRRGRRSVGAGSIPHYTIGLATLTGGRPLTPHYADQLSRAVLKVGFECAWDEQRDVLLDRAFDDIRDVIRGGCSRAGHLFVGSEVNERNTGINVRRRPAGHGREYLAPSS